MIEKKAVLLHQQTYPASRKISALRVSLFCKYGKLHRQTTLFSAADRSVENQWTQLSKRAQSVAYVAADQLLPIEELSYASDERQDLAHLQERCNF